MKTFNEIRFPPTGTADEQLVFVILELLSNSIRAHKERGKTDPVIAELRSDDTLVRIRISDKGGGFDPGSLPYSINESVESINLMSEAFAHYRERYENSRFGMGLIATRRIFPEFKLAFVDGDSKETAWPSEAIVGTVITLGIPILQRGVTI